MYQDNSKEKKHEFYSKNTVGAPKEQVARNNSRRTTIING